MNAVLQEERVFDRIAFGRRIARARRACDLTQRSLAHRLGCRDAESVANWERGRTMPRTDTLVHIALALGVDAEWLLFGDPERGPRLS